MKVVLLGSGNVAYHLGHALSGLGHSFLQIYSRALVHAQALADSLDSTAIDTLEEISPVADLYILAVSDQAIPVIVAQIPPTIQGIIIHTSGATDLSVLAKFRSSGVIYPPQSLKKGVATDLSKIPFGIEASDASSLELLMELMLPISSTSFHCSSSQRLALHTASVFANNFPNALFQVAHDILQRENLSFDLIRPIISETATNVQQHLPKEVQTGPAIRGDLTTIAKHLDYLKQDYDWQSIYQLISAYISKK